MPTFRIAGNEIVEYEQDIEADTEEQAQDIFVKNFNDFVPVDSHSWVWYDTQEITDEEKKDCVKRNEALIAWKKDHFGSSEGFDAAWGTNEDFRDKDYTDPDVHFEEEY